jgi:hypothetical protein
VRYQLVQPNGPMPTYDGLTPYKAIVAIEAVVERQWQSRMSQWLVESGCLYMMAWGNDCSSWDDSVDYANMEQFDYGEIPDDRNVMTTWHEDETISEVFDFAKRHARPFNDATEFRETVVFHISDVGNQDEFERLYAAA